MSYVVFGRRHDLARVASHPSIEAVLAEIRGMQRDGFQGVEVLRQFQPPVPAAVFVALHAPRTVAAA